MVLTSCSTLEPNSAESLQTTTKPEIAPVAQQKKMPEAAVDEGLTADLLYDLLVSSIAYQEGELDVASDALIRAAHSTGDPELISRAVRMAIHNNNYVQAVELGQRWIALTPEDYQAGIITALAAAMNQQPEIAMDILTPMMQQADDKVGLRFGQLGEMFLQFAEGEAAQQVLLQMASQYPDSSEAWLVLAGMAQKNQDFSAMNTALDQILLLEPGSEKAAGYKLLALKNDEKAQSEFALVFLKNYPNATDFRMHYARLLLRLENEEEAILQLQRVLERDGNNSEALNLLALLYQARENYIKASEYFVLRIKEMPADDRSRLYLANALQQLEQYDEAKVVLSEISDVDELFAAGRQMSLLIEQADGVEAALEYLRTLQGNTQAQRIQLIIDHELMLQRAGRAEEAYALIDNTLAQYPDDDTLRYHRALIFAEQIDLKGHEADMRILLSHKPDNAHYNNTLGYSLLVMSDRLEEAAELINRAYEFQADDPYILDSKGWLEYKLGNLDSALMYLNKAFLLDQDAEIAAHIGEVYWVKGDKEKAQEFWREGDRIDPINKSLQKTKARFLE